MLANWAWKGPAGEYVGAAKNGKLVLDATDTNGNRGPFDIYPP